MASNLGAEGAGIFCAVKGLSDDLYIVVAGPGATHRAGKLFRQFSHLFVVPQTEADQLGIQVKLPGIYIISEGKNPAGPYTELTAIEALKKNSKN